MCTAQEAWEAHQALFEDMNSKIVIAMIYASYNEAIRLWLQSLGPERARLSSRVGSTCCIELINLQIVTELMHPLYEE